MNRFENGFIHGTSVVLLSPVFALYYCIVFCHNIMKQNSHTFYLTANLLQPYRLKIFLAKSVTKFNTNFNTLQLCVSFHRLPN